MRCLYEVLVEACPEDEQHLAREEREITIFRVRFAGPAHSLAISVEKGLWAQKLHSIRTLSCRRVRKAKGRGFSQSRLFARDQVGRITEGRLGPVGI